VAVKDRRPDGKSDLIHLVDELLLPGNVFQRFMNFSFDGGRRRGWAAGCVCAVRVGRARLPCICHLPVFV
jgi:hypothetical protein